MIEEQAQVIALSGDDAIIEMQSQTACQSCEMSGGCGTGSLGRLLGNRRQRLSISNDQHLKVGNLIVIGLPEKHFIYAGFLMYLLPLLSLFMFSIVANILFDATQWINVLAALMGLVSGLKLTSVFSNNIFAEKLRPRFIRQEFSIEMAKPNSLHEARL